MDIINETIIQLGHCAEKHFPFIIGVVINLIILWILYKLIDKFLRNLESRLRVKNSDSPLLNLMPIFDKSLKAIAIFVIIAGFLQSFGYNVTSLIAGFGITGLAVGFAAKEAIGNVFGSIGLLSDKVYKIGDYIIFNGYEGTVEKINFRSTTVRTPEGFVVNVPNNVLSNEEITNLSQANSRRLDLTVDIEYSTTNEKIERAKEILKEIAKQNENLEGDEKVFLENLAPSSIQVRLVAYSKKSQWKDFVEIKGQIIEEIIKQYREENIGFAFPSTSVYIEKE